MVEATNSEKNWPVVDIKGAGYVQNMPAVAVLEYPGTVRMFGPPSNSLIADR